MCEHSGRECLSCHQTWTIHEPELICDDARKRGSLCEPSPTVVQRRKTEPRCLDCAVAEAEARARQVSRRVGGDARRARWHLDRWRFDARRIVRAAPGLGQGSGGEVKEEGEVTLGVEDCRAGVDEACGLGTGVEASTEAGEGQSSRKGEERWSVKR